MKSLIYIGMVSLLAVAAGAQGPGADDGVLGPRLENDHVFIEPMTGDLVVSYANGAAGLTRVTFRVRLPHHVQPESRGFRIAEALGNA